MLSELTLEGVRRVGGGICVVGRLPQGPKHMEIPQYLGVGLR